LGTLQTRRRVHQPAALMWQHEILHDRTRNRGLFIGYIVEDAHEVAGMPLM
jgi:hypothetical protein